MGENVLQILIDEVRQEFQIPPYFEDSGLKNYVLEGEAVLLGLNPGRDVESDLRYRSLLKSYVYYAYHHQINEWRKNYAFLILEWQLGTEVEE